MTDKCGAMQDRDASSEVRLRRQIERSLHDGIQQDLVALAVKLQLARQVADDQAALQKLLDEIEQDVLGALESIRSLADRIYPSTLATFGLREALRGLAATTGSSIEVEELGRYAAEIEASVFFRCRDALENASVRGERPTLRIWQEDEGVRFEVAQESGHRTQISAVIPIT
jgi:signal transduction histidine kinase